MSTPIRSQPSPVVLLTPRLVLSLPAAEHGKAMLRFFIDNREHLAAWSPPRPPGFYSEEFWAWRLEENRREYVQDRSLRLCLHHRDEPGGPIIGAVNFSEFVRGAFQSCFLGYQIDHRWEGRGLMREAIRAGVEHVFGRLAMHRVAANYMPENTRSGALLARLGFTVEGYARQYLFINGAWRDHVLTALLNPALAAPGTVSST